MDMSYFQKINNVHKSKSRQETDLFLTNRHVDARFADSIDYHVVKQNGDDLEALIIRDSETNYHKKKIKTKHDNPIQVGDYIEFADTYWLITEKDVDDKLYHSGKMKMCNWILTWQRKDGSIARYWCIDENATQYNSGETSTNAGKITFGSAQHAITIQANEDTIPLDSPQRFFIDRNMENPTPYKVAQNDTVDNFFGRGLLNLMVVQDVLNTDVDALVEMDDGEKVWIADYFSPITNEDNKPDHNGVTSSIEGKREIVYGSSRTFTALFVDEDNNELSGIDYEWNMVSDLGSKVSFTENSSTQAIKIKIDNDEELIDSSFLLQLIIDNVVVSEVQVLIKGLF